MLRDIVSIEVSEKIPPIPVELLVLLLLKLKE